MIVVSIALWKLIVLIGLVLIVLVVAGFVLSHLRYRNGYLDGHEDGRWYQIHLGSDM